MRISCPNCTAQYDLDERLLPASGAPVQCTSCNHVFVALPKSAGADAPAHQTLRFGKDAAQAPAGQTGIYGAPRAEPPASPTAPGPQGSERAGAGRTTSYGAVPRAPAATPDPSSAMRQTMVFGTAKKTAESPSAPHGTQAPAPEAPPSTSAAMRQTMVFGAAKKATESASAPKSSQVPAPVAPPSASSAMRQTMVFGTAKKGAESASAPQGPQSPVPVAPPTTSPALRQTMVFGAAGAPAENPQRPAERKPPAADASKAMRQTMVFGAGAKPAGSELDAPTVGYGEVSPFAGESAPEEASRHGTRAFGAVSEEALHSQTVGYGMQSPFAAEDAAAAARADGPPRPRKTGEFGVVAKPDPIDAQTLGYGMPSPFAAEDDAARGSEALDEDDAQGGDLDLDSSTLSFGGASPFANEADAARRKTPGFGSTPADPPASLRETVRPTPFEVASAIGSGRRPSGVSPVVVPEPPPLFSVEPDRPGARGDSPDGFKIYDEAPERSGFDLRRIAILLVIGVACVGIAFFAKRIIAHAHAVPQELLEREQGAMTMLRRDDSAAQQQVAAQLDALAARAHGFLAFRADQTLILALQLDDLQAPLKAVGLEIAQIDRQVAALQSAKSPSDWEVRVNALRDHQGRLRDEAERIQTDARALRVKLERALATLPPATEAATPQNLAVVRARAVAAGVSGSGTALELAERYAKLGDPGGWATVTLAEYVLNAEAPPETVDEVRGKLGQLKGLDPFFIRPYVLLGRLDLADDHLQAATSELEAVATLDPNHALDKRLLESLSRLSEAPQQP